jgi:hypothetical protein
MAVGRPARHSVGSKLWKPLQLYIGVSVPCEAEEHRPETDQIPAYTVGFGAEPLKSAAALV